MRISVRPGGGYKGKQAAERSSLNNYTSDRQHLSVDGCGGLQRAAEGCGGKRREEGEGGGGGGGGGGEGGGGAGAAMRGRLLSAAAIGPAKKTKEQ